MGSFAYLLAFLLSFLISGPFDGAKADTCAREWLQYQGNCYGYFEQKMTWEEAEIDCQSYHRGAHLASILTVSEALVAANHIAAYQIEPSNVWIGLHDIRHGGPHRFLLMMLQLLTSGLVFLCLGLLLLSLYLWYKDGRFAFRFHFTPHLPPLGLQPLALVLKLLLCTFILLGVASFYVQNGKWRWSDESTYNYKAWMTGRPDNYGKNEYCVELVYFANKAALPDGEENQQAAERVSPLSFSHHIKLQGFTKWNDAPCQRLNGYICKHEL